MEGFLIFNNHKIYQKKNTYFSQKKISSVILYASHFPQNSVLTWFGKSNVVLPALAVIRVLKMIFYTKMCRDTKFNVQRDRCLWDVGLKPKEAEIWRVRYCKIALGFEDFVIDHVLSWKNLLVHIHGQWCFVWQGISALWFSLETITPQSHARPIE